MNQATTCPGVIILEECNHCKEDYNPDDMLETGKGNYCCEECSYDFCTQCLEGEPEVEYKDDYICSDCYSGHIDNAYEYYRDRD